MANLITEGAAQAIALQDGGSFSNERDVQLHYVYDTRLVPAVVAPSDFIYYSQPIGAAYGGGVKGLVETNLYDPGKLPNGQRFTIKRILVTLHSLIAAATVDATLAMQAYINILQASTIEIKIPPREFDLQVPGRCFVPAAPAYGHSAANGSFRTGDTIASGYVSLGDTPIVIDNLVTFQVIHHINSAVAANVVILNANSAVLNALGASVGIALEGVLTRGK
jgi:hypothetical protein